MNILVLSWRDIRHPLAGGAEQVMHEHAKGWIAAGHSVTHFSATFKGSKLEEEIDGVKIIRRGHRYLGVQWEAYKYYQKNKDNIDLVIDEFHGFPFFTPLYIKKPILSVIQETARKVWFLNQLPWPMNWLVGVVGYLSEPFIFLIYKNTKFMTGSESAKSDVVKMGIPIKNVTVIPHGVIIKKSIPMPTREKIFTVTFLGILSKDKGIEDGLRAFAILSKKGQFQFWVIGRPENQEYEITLNKLIKDLGVLDKVSGASLGLKFWGFVSQEEKFKLLARSHILINPSVHEGWGLVNIEANAMGTPIVAYNSAGLVDSVKDGISGIICNQNSPENLAENVMLLTSNEKLLQKLQRGAITWSKNFSWEKSIKKSLELISLIKS